jgi:hypothetical protein
MFTLNTLNWYFWEAGSPFFLLCQKVTRDLFYEHKFEPRKRCWCNSEGRNDGLSRLLHRLILTPEIDHSWLWHTVSQYIVSFIISFVLFHFILVLLGLELRAWSLLERHSTTWVIPSALVSFLKHIISNPLWPCSFVNITYTHHKIGS